MASGSYMQAAVVCPFYCSDDGHRKIVCEGLVHKYEEDENP